MITIVKSKDELEYCKHRVCYIDKTWYKESWQEKNNDVGVHITVFFSLIRAKNFFKISSLSSRL